MIQAHMGGSWLAADFPQAQDQSAALLRLLGADEQDVRFGDVHETGRTGGQQPSRSPLHGHREQRIGRSPAETGRLPKEFEVGKGTLPREQLRVKLILSPVLERLVECQPQRDRFAAKETEAAPGNFLRF